MLFLSFLKNSETIVVTNLNSFSSVSKSFSLFLIADSVTLSCSSGLKEFKISTLQIFAYLYKREIFRYFCFFIVFVSSKKSSFCLFTV